jgi:hypothetical protein
MELFCPLQHQSSKGWPRNIRQRYFVEGAEPIKAEDFKDGTGLKDYMVRRVDRGYEEHVRLRDFSGAELSLYLTLHVIQPMGA